MTDQEKKSPLDPIEKTSYACSICGALKDTEEEARKCAMDDTSKLEIDKAIERTQAGYPRVFNASFRTGISSVFAAVKKCLACDGSGDATEEGGNTYPCNKCNATGWVVDQQ
jgi:DnaJ-class molecular chaperone